MEPEIAWPLNSVVYQIYPRSFYDNNGDGIGDLKGITQKLEYLKDLGITAIWLSPIYPSPMADFGYDIADYEDIDPIFGDLSDFDELVEKAHSKNIRIMMDFVPNHTSDKHKWFMESRSSRDNPKRDWYIWRDGKADGSPPNNWLSVFGGSAWEYDEVTKQYYYHAFDKGQPDLNWRNPEVVEAMMNALRFWLDRGVDGFRVDAIYWLFEDPEFGDEAQNPNFQQGVHAMYDMLLHEKTFKRDETLDMVKKMVDVCREYEHRFLVTEAYLGIPDLIKMYQTIDWEFYAPFNFSFITLPWKADVHKGYIDEFDAKIGPTHIPVYAIGNHDVHRIATRIGGDQARIAAILQLTLRGLPFIYQGEELGMTDGQIPPDRVKDPQEKGNPGMGIGRDPERTPMQWDATRYAGFSQAEPWLPVAENFETVNVTSESQDEHSMFSLYKQLIHLKKTKKSLREGSYEPLPQPAEDVLAFMRKKEDEEILVVLNLCNEPRKISIPAKGKVLCDEQLKHIDEEINLNNYELAGNEGIIILTSEL